MKSRHRLLISILTSLLDMFLAMLVPRNKVCIIFLQQRLEVGDESRGRTVTAAGVYLEIGLITWSGSPDKCEERRLGGQITMLNKVGEWEVNNNVEV